MAKKPADSSAAETPPAPPPPKIKVVIAGPTEMERELIPLINDGWTLNTVASCNHSNEHAAYLVRSL